MCLKGILWLTEAQLQVERSEIELAPSDTQNCMSSDAHTVDKDVNSVYFSSCSGKLGIFKRALILHVQVFSSVFDVICVTYCINKFNQVVQGK